MSLVTDGFGDYPGNGPAVAFILTGVVVAAQQLTLNLNATPLVSGPAVNPAAYTVVPNGNGVPVQVTSVQVSGNTVVLGTTAMTIGAAYTLVIPSVGLISADGRQFNGTFTPGFTGAGVAPFLVQAASVDARTLQVVYSEPVNASDATNPANYSIVPPLAVTAVSRVTSLVYVLTTARQARGQVYTVTASNVRDLANNPD